MSDIPDDWIPIAIGVYDDGRGGLHLIMPDLLAANGYADTPAHRELIITAAKQILKQFGPRGIVHVED
jgi:hypothetical protein